MGLSRMAYLFPYFAQGKVVKGFGRGSKELGIPTANFPDSVVDKLPADFDNGIYYGWASVQGGTVHRMVMSVGWNPFYQNVKKTMETHIMHKYEEDFYDSILRVCILGYLRPETNFSSLDDLITAIHEDIRQANNLLDQPENLSYQSNLFFTQPTNHRL